MRKLKLIIYNKYLNLRERSCHLERVEFWPDIWPIFIKFILSWSIQTNFGQVGHDLFNNLTHFNLTNHLFATSIVGWRRREQIGKSGGRGGVETRLYYLYICLLYWIFIKTANLIYWLIFFSSIIISTLFREVDQFILVQLAVSFLQGDANSLVCVKSYLKI